MYKPLEERTPDFQYQNVLKHILEHGEKTKHPYQEVGKLVSLTTPNMIFNLSNGVPIITERKISFWKKAVSEILIFIHGLREMHQFASFDPQNWPSWWQTWATPEKCALFDLEPGDLGPGSYGPGFNPVMPNGEVFKQFEMLVGQIKRSPYATTHVVSPWVPYYALQDSLGKRQVVVAPCHGWLQFDIIGDTINMRMDQRSADVPIGVPANMIQYSALLLMMAQVTGYKAGTFIHSMHNVHIYENQIPKVRELVGREPRPFPRMFIKNTSINNLFDFRSNDFEIDEYNPHPAMNDIPVTE